MQEQCPYLPKWATLDEASAWLEDVTGERWPLPRLLESGLMPSVWLAPGPAVFQPEVMRQVFEGRTGGYLAPLVFCGDTTRLAADRTGCLTMTRSAAGAIVRFTPGIDFTAADIRFAAEALKETAALIGAKPAAAIEKLMRAPLIARYSSLWDIAGDLREASRNGLSAAKLGGGFWDVAKVLAWAKERGRPTESRPPVAQKWMPSQR